MRIIRMWSQLLKGNEYGTTSRTLHSGEMCRQAGSQVHQRLHLKPAWTLTSLHSQPKKTKAKNRQNYKNTKRAISTAAPLHIPHSVFTHSENNTYPPPRNRPTWQSGLMLHTRDSLDWQSRILSFCLAFLQHVIWVSLSEGCGFLISM